MKYNIIVFIITFQTGLLGFSQSENVIIKEPRPHKCSNDKISLNHGMGILKSLKTFFVRTLIKDSSFFENMFTKPNQTTNKKGRIIKNLNIKFSFLYI